MGMLCLIQPYTAYGMLFDDELKPDRKIFEGAIPCQGGSQKISYKEILMLIDI
jgi:hypothetical protein